MPLTDTAIRAIKPTSKTAKFFDGGGLYLEVAPAGASGGGSNIAFRARKKEFPWEPTQPLGLKKPENAGKIQKKS